VVVAGVLRHAERDRHPRNLRVAAAVVPEVPPRVRQPEPPQAEAGDAVVECS
jgi:hypothetical protein